MPYTSTFMRVSRTSFITVFEILPQILAFIDEQVGSQPLITAYQPDSEMTEWLNMLAGHNFHYFYSQTLEL